MEKSDSKLLEDVWYDHGHNLWKYANVLCGKNAATADDLVQEAMLALAIRISREPVANAKAYLYGTVRNLWADMAADKPVDLLADMPIVVRQEVAPDRPTIKDLEKFDIKLSKRLEQFFVIWNEHDRDSASIARRMGMDEESLKVYRNRVRGSLLKQSIDARDTIHQAAVHASAAVNAACGGFGFGAGRVGDGGQAVRKELGFHIMGAVCQFMYPEMAEGYFANPNLVRSEFSNEVAEPLATLMIDIIDLLKRPLEVAVINKLMIDTLHFHQQGSGNYRQQLVSIVDGIHKAAMSVANS